MRIEKIFIRLINKCVYISDNIYNWILLKQAGAILEGKVTTYGRLRVMIDGGKLRCGENLVIRSSWKSNPAGGGQTHTLFRICKEGKMTIGNNVGISNSSFFCSKEIMIEDDVMIGVDCVIMDTDHHSTDYISRMNGNDNIKKEKVVIRKGAWIGGHCIILKGVEVGEKSVIGAGSVLTKSVPNGEIWGGNPADFIKKL